MAAWYQDREIAEEWLNHPRNHATTLEVIAWLDEAPDEWEWLAHEAQLRAYRRKDVIARDLLDDLMEAPQFGYAEAGERLPKCWVLWVGMLLIYEFPHIADWIRLPKVGKNGWPRPS